jgi:O-antigen/teichoic acid export membrane protein
VGWPVKAFQDVLRGSQLFVQSAIAEGFAFVVVGAALVALGLEHAELWILVGVGGSVPLITGLLSAVVVRQRKLPYGYRRALLTAATVRGFFVLSVNLFISGIADAVIYALDRAVLATFRSAAVVGLYEGPVRAHNLVLQTQSSLATPIISVSARYTAEGDVQRSRDLLVRGTRYILAATVPLTLVLTILAKPILTVWLGPKYAVAATAMSILVGYSLLLTPSLGLNGVVLGTTLAYALAFPFFIRLALRILSVSLEELAREAWLPAYLTGAVLAAGLLAVRFTFSLDSLPEVLGAGVVAALAYWIAYYFAWLRPSERALVRSVASAPLAGGRRFR